MDLAERIREVLELDPDADAIQYQGVWHSWRELRAVADAVDGLLEACGCGADARVGMLLRNHPAMVGAMLGVVSGRRCIVTVNPHQGDAKLADDVATLRLPVVVGLDAELHRPGLAERVAATGMTAIAVHGGLEDPAGFVPGLDCVQHLGDDARRPGIAVEMLTSGTTGPPKRIPLAYEAFERTIGAAGQHYRQRAADPEPSTRPRLRSGVAIISAPFVHMSGIFRTLLNVCEGRRVVLLDRFDVDEWVHAVREHRPRAVSLVPTALRMVLEADVEPDDLSSIEVVTSGSAPLDPGVQRAFEARFDLAVLPSYGATEFAGGVAGWTLPLHREWGERKLGSVGRPQPGRALRVVDPETGAPVSTDAVGLLEVGSTADPEAWTRTTDLARLDEEGFLWIAGRADDAILRGGFKVFPGDVAAVLKQHPAVRDCGVTGIPDERLGAVPVAAVELAEGATADAAELMAHARAHLTAYQVPREILVVPALPRTASMKVSAPGVAALFEPTGVAGA
jgi:acyl-CoA synthetase (AMP-forming)/AMP-acid ligase II